MQQPLSHQLTEDVKLLQKAVMLHRGAVLLLKRSATAVSRPGAWDLPGGNSEWPEPGNSGFGLHVQDLVREIQEETAVQIAPDGLQHQDLVYFTTFFDEQKQVFSIICGWRVQLDEAFDRANIQLSAEHSECVWAPVGEVAEYDFGGIQGEFIRELVLSVGEEHGE